VQRVAARVRPGAEVHGAARHSDGDGLVFRALFDIVVAQRQAAAGHENGRRVRRRRERDILNHDIA